MQVFNPYGPSEDLQDMELDEWWDGVSNGSDYVMFHSELAAEDDKRTGVGVSRTAETLLEAIKAFKHDHVKALIKDKATSSHASLKYTIKLTTRPKFMTIVRN